MVYLSVKPHYQTLIVTLAFLAHVSSTIRQTVLQELRERLAYLYFPSRIAESKHKTPSGGTAASGGGAQRPDASGADIGSGIGGGSVKSPLQRTESETPCCYAVAKPLDRFLIQFEPKCLARNLTGFADTEKLNLQLQIISRQLHFRRFVWHVVWPAEQQPSPAESAGQLPTRDNLLHIFNCLVALRLQQGFHFAYANAGFVNLFRRVALQPSETAATAAIGDGNEGSGDVELCVQYLLYPLISRRRLDSESSEATVLEESSSVQRVSATPTAVPASVAPHLHHQHQQPAGNRQLLDLRIVTEVWAEPQPGRPLPSDLARETTDWLDADFQLLPGLLRDSDERVFCVFLTLDAALKSVASAATTVSNAGVCRSPECRQRQRQGSGAGKGGDSTWRQAISDKVQQLWTKVDLISLVSRSAQACLLLSLIQTDEPDCHEQLIRQLEQELMTRRFCQLPLTCCEEENYTRHLAARGGAGMESLVQPDQLQLLAQQQGWCCYALACKSRCLQLLFFPASAAALSQLLQATGENAFPIYAYCVNDTWLADSLANQWSFSPPQDVTLRYRLGEPAPKYIEREAFCAGAARRGGVVCTSEKLLDDCGKLHTHLNQMVEAMSDVHALATVRTIFQASQQRLVIEETSLQAALDELLEEQASINIDLTDFLAYSCGHAYYGSRLDRQKQQQLQQQEALIRRLSRCCEASPGAHQRSGSRFRATIGKYFSELCCLPGYFALNCGCIDALLNPGANQEADTEDDDEGDDDRGFRVGSSFLVGSDTGENTDTAVPENELNSGQQLDINSVNAVSAGSASAKFAAARRRRRHLSAAEADDLGEELRQQRSLAKRSPLFLQYYCTAEEVESDGPDDTDDNRQLDNDKEASSDAGDDVDADDGGLQAEGRSFFTCLREALPLPAEVAGRPADELQELMSAAAAGYRASLILLPLKPIEPGRVTSTPTASAATAAAVAEGDAKKSANAAATEVAAESAAAGEKFDAATAQSDNNVDGGGAVNEAGAVSGNASTSNTEEAQRSAQRQKRRLQRKRRERRAPALAVDDVDGGGRRSGQDPTDSDQLDDDSTELGGVGGSGGVAGGHDVSQPCSSGGGSPAEEDSADDDAELVGSQETDEDDEGEDGVSGGGLLGIGRGFPQLQREILFQCHRELQWVLSDEIVNIMRCRPPITEAVLDRVVSHVTAAPEALGSEERAAAQGISSFSVDFDSEDTEADYQFVFGVAESVKVFYNYLAEETIRVGGSLHRFRELGRYHYLARCGGGGGAGASAGAPAKLPAVSVDNLQQQQLSKQREALQQLEQQRKLLRSASDSEIQPLDPQLVPSLLNNSSSRLSFSSLLGADSEVELITQLADAAASTSAPTAVTTSSTVVDSTSAASAAAAATDAEVFKQDLPAVASTAAAAVEESPVPPVRSLSTQQPMVYQQQHQLQSMTLRTVSSTPRRHKSGDTPTTRCSTQTPQPFSRPESSTGEGYDAGESCSAEDEDNDDEGRGGGGGDSVGHEPDAFATLLSQRAWQQLPDCWLVCQFEAAKNTLTFYQHHSDKHVTEDGGLSARCNLCDLMPTVRATVAKLIYRVNQLKLLEEMQTTLRCREMLVPAGSDDIVWQDPQHQQLQGQRHVRPQIHQRHQLHRPFQQPPHQQLPHFHRQQRRESVALITGDFDAAADNNSNNSDEASSDDEASREPAPLHYEVRVQMEPGKFQCEMQTCRDLPLHPRMRVSQGSYNSVAILREHLSYLSVSNRKNMLVMRDTDGDGQHCIFYLLLNEVPKPSSNPRRSLPDTSSAPVLLNSAAAATTVSSAVSQNFQAASALDLSSANSSAAAAAAAAAAATIAASEAASVAANTAALLQSPSESRTSGMQLPPHQQSRPPAVTDILSVSVYGLRKPTKLVLECIGSMKTKLDSIVLLKLSDLLSRTPYTKLTAEDINFIQHPLDAAVESFRLRLPSLVKDFTLPFLVYLKQNFNLAFIAPKYRDHACQFRCQWGPGDFGNLGEIYLWNMGFSQGQRYDGIACITCRLLLGNHPMRPTLNSLLVRPQLAFESDDSPADFDSWVAMETVCAPAGSGSSTRSSPAAQASRTAPPPPLHPTLEFKVWKRGGVTVEGLVERVSTCVRHALEDLAMEHRLLTLPFSEVPPEVRKEAADAAAEAAAAACPANKAATGAADDAVAAAATPSERDSPLMSPGGSRRLTASAASRSQQQQLQASIGQSSSSSLSLFTRAIKGGGIQAQATPAATPTPAPPATPSVASVIREFEFGDSGCMNPFYHRVLRPWFARFSKKSSSDQDHQPCQQRSVKLYSAKSIDHFLKHDLPGCLPNLTYAVYEASPGSDPSAAEWTRHSFDTAAAAVDRLPGRKRHFMVLCRSRALWYDALRIAGDPSAAAASAAGPADASASTSANDGASESGSVAGGGVSAPLLKLASFSLTAHGYPSFCPPPGPAALESATSLASVSAAACPHLASIVGGGIETPVSTDSEVSSLNSRPTAPPAKEEAAVCDAAVHTVHRQLFVMICISGKDVTFYSYNLNKQLLDSINERLRNCLAYINQRFLAFKSHVVCPKLGLSHLIPADSMRGPIVNYLHPSAPGGQSASTSAGGVSASSSASAAVVRSRGGQHQLTSAMQLRHRPATQRQHQHHQHQHQLYHPPSASAADAAVGPSGASALVVRDPFTVCRLGLRRANLADLRRESAVASGGSSGSVCDDLYWLFLQLLRLAQMQESRLHHWRKLSALHNDAYGSSATIDLFGSAQLAASGLSPQDLVAALKASLRPVHAVASPIRFDLSRANRPRQARFSLGQQQQPQQQQPQHPQMHRETSAPTGGVAGSTGKQRRKSSTNNPPLASALGVQTASAAAAAAVAAASGGPIAAKLRHESSAAAFAVSGATPSSAQQQQPLPHRQQSKDSTVSDPSASFGGSGAWYANLKADMVRAYSDYLTRKDKLFGNYKLLLLAPAAPGAELLPNMPAPHLGLHYRLLVKVMDNRNGVIVIEVFCRDDYLHVHLSVLEGSRLALPPGGAFHLVKSASRHIVECVDLMRDYTHVHSFCHDYHLRLLSDYIQDRRPTPLKTVRGGYDVVSFLRAFTKAIQQPPLYANHYAYVTQFSATSKNIGREKIFKYMQANQQRYPVRVMQTQSESPGSSSEYCLIHHTEDLSQQHSVLYVISQDKSSPQPDTVDFSVFILLLDRTASFPIQRLLRLVGGSGGSSRTRASSASLALEPRHIRPGRILPPYQLESLPEHQQLHHQPDPATDVLGYTAEHQWRLRESLALALDRVRGQLSRTVHAAAADCHRDLLWSRLFASLDSDCPGQSEQLHLDLSEFEELLARAAVQIPAEDLDPRISRILNMRQSFADYVFERLCERYRPGSALFTGAGACAYQYLAIRIPQLLSNDNGEGEIDNCGANAGAVPLEDDDFDEGSRWRRQYQRRQEFLLVRRTMQTSHISLLAVLRRDNLTPDGSSSPVSSSPEQLLSNRGLVARVHDVVEQCVFKAWHSLYCPGSS
ncbi:hypothetical protein BOX15_Mlig006837g3 [Macrostomum lignano]|uniref:Uncharacterized protein n=2 Tax=Macrostomum lignano TaxID=282301 RepID=A0A267H3N6_9PLAT|nr:hypothetical protein BOX15_Mlig006837g3 [Macrostomum lignano]